MSKFRGVYARGDAFEAYLGHEGQRLFVGRFRTEVEAARAYDAEAVRILGTKANLNFPGEPSMQQDATDADIQDYRNGRGRRSAASQDIQTLRIADLKVDGGTQSRNDYDLSRVKHLQELIEDDVELEPGVCYFDGEQYWVSEGFHRIAASRAAGKSDIKMEVRKGGQRQARWNGIGSNAKNGMPYARRDFQHMLEMLMNDTEWSKLPDKQLAKKVGCHFTYASRIRRELNEKLRAGGRPVDTERQVERSGKKYMMKLDAVVSKAKGEDEPEQETAGASVDKSNDAPAEIPIPEKLESVFAEITDIDKACEQQRWVSAAINKLRKNPSWQLHSDILDEAWRQSKAIYQAVSNARPECPCLDCGGTKDTCGTCKSYGWMNADQAEAWRGAHPEEL